MLYCVNFAYLTWKKHDERLKVGYGSMELQIWSGTCKCSLTFMAFCIGENPVPSLKTSLKIIIHWLVFLHTSNQMVSSKSSNHEMTWLNPQRQNFRFYQSDKFFAKSICWQASSSQCWRLSWRFFCVCCWTGCISIFISLYYHILMKSSLNVLCILWSFWLASIQIGVTLDPLC